MDLDSNMTKYISSYLIWLMLIFTMLSCEEAFESAVDFEVPEQPSLLATTAIFPLNAISSQLYVSHTVNILDPDPVAIKNASIDLSIEGHSKFAWVFDSITELYVASLPRQNEILGKNAKLTIEAPGYSKSRSSILVPDTAHVGEIKFGYQKAFDLDGSKADLLTLNIDDPGGQDNFYGVTAFYIRRLEVGSLAVRDTVRLYLQSDGLVTEGSHPIFFSDATFDGKETLIRITSFSYTPGRTSEPHILVRVYSYPKAYYLYLKSRVIYGNAEGNPFAEPSDIYSNMDGGEGIFSIHPVNEYKVEVDL